MTPDRTKAILQQIVDRVSRDDLHGQSLRSLCKRGLLKRNYANDEDGPIVLSYRLTKAGRDFLTAGQQTR